MRYDLRGNDLKRLNLISLDVVVSWVKPYFLPQDVSLLAKKKSRFHHEIQEQSAI